MEGENVQKYKVVFFHFLRKKTIKRKALRPNGDFDMVWFEEALKKALAKKRKQLKKEKKKKPSDL